MQVSMEKTGDLERKMTVQVPAADIDGQVSSRLNELRRKVRLKGFRPGKVPMKVVRQRYGKQVREEVLQQVMQSSLQDAITEQQLRVAGVSSIQPGDSGDGGAFEFTARLEVFPELPEIDVSGLDIERPQVEITEADVDDMIQTLREQRRKWTSAGRPAAAGDRVRVRYGAEVDGQRVPETGHQEIAPVLGSGVLFEQFEKALIGKESGAKLSQELQFPSDFRDPQLAGRSAQVEIRVTTVETSELPEADDEFAESFGVDGGMDQMRVEVRKNLEREMRQTRTARLTRAVTEQLASTYSDFSLPASSVLQEARQMQAQVRQQTGSDEDLPLERFTEAAEKRVRLGLLMSEIARQNDLEIDPARAQAKIEEIADTYEQPGEVIELYRSNSQLLDSIHNLVLEEQVVEWVLEQAGAPDKPMSFKELMDQS